MSNTAVPAETYEQLGQEIGDATVGDLIINAKEYGDRLDAQGEKGAQAALDAATAPKVEVDEATWGN